MSEIIHYRKEKDKQWATINLHCSDHDPNLSAKAKWIHIYIISRPPGWKLNMRDIANRCTDGEHGIRSGMKELMVRNYVHRGRIIDRFGRGTDTKYLAFDFPTSRAEAIEIFNEINEEGLTVVWEETVKTTDVKITSQKTSDEKSVGLVVNKELVDNISNCSLPKGKEYAANGEGDVPPQRKPRAPSKKTSLVGHVAAPVKKEMKKQQTSVNEVEQEPVVSEEERLRRREANMALKERFSISLRMVKANVLGLAIPLVPPLRTRMSQKL